MRKIIYLDHNASTPLAEEVVSAMIPWLENSTGNPSSSHEFGMKCRAAIDNARRQLANMLACHPIEIIFNSGGTEANNTVLQGIARTHSSGHIITSKIEHPAILEVCDFLETRGFEVSRIGVNAEGFVDPEAVQNAIRSDTILISIMLANNEVGTLQAIREIAKISHEKNILCHTDAAQAAGKIEIDVAELGVDMLSIAGHKLNAPKGVGALYLRNGVELPPLMFGGGHEKGLRPGTENVLEIVGLGAAAARFSQNSEMIIAETKILRDCFENLLEERVPAIRFNGPRENRLPNTASISFEGVKVDDLLFRCKGFAASGGAACHIDGDTPSYVLTAMGISSERAATTIRFSVGYGTTMEDMNAAVSEIEAAVLRIRNR
jgi:cysteine desulfurase